LGHFYFFKQTKFEITLRRLVQKKFCEQKNLHFLISKKVWGRIFDKNFVSFFTMIFRNLALVFAGILCYNQVFW
jgi:hypothetical protein